MLFYVTSMMYTTHYSYILCLASKNCRENEIITYFLPGNYTLDIIRKFKKKVIICDHSYDVNFI